MNKRLNRFSVLIVDDDVKLANLLTNLLRQLGIGRVHQCSNGAEALAQLKEVHVDFVITDWRMPVMDGIEMLRRLRNDEVYRSIQAIPVIMLTGYCEAHQVHLARDAGANVYLIKPFTARQLLTRIIEIVDTPRAFVVASGYAGPCRRRKNTRISHSERRQSQKARRRPFKRSALRRWLERRSASA